MNRDGVIALDLNTKSCGVAYGKFDWAAPKLTTWALPGSGDEGALTLAYGRLYASIVGIADLVCPAWVAIEAPFFFKDDGKSNAHTLAVLHGLTCVARAAGVNCGAKVNMVAVSTWRKHFTGHGRPKDPKGATLHMCKILGWSPQNDDEGDAAGLWAYEMALRYPKWGPGTAPLVGRVSA